MNLTLDVLYQIVELLKDDSKALLRFLSLNKRMRGLLKEIGTLNPKKMKQIDFLMAIDRVGRKQDALRAIMSRDMKSYGEQGTQLTKLKKMALGMGAVDSKAAAGASKILLMGLVGTRKSIKRLAQEVRAEIQLSIKVYSEVGKYLDEYRQHLDGSTDKALFDAMEHECETKGSKGSLLKQYGKLDICILKPYNDCVDVCNLLQMAGVPAKITVW